MLSQSKALAARGKVFEARDKILALLKADNSVPQHLTSPDVVRWRPCRELAPFKPRFSPFPPFKRQGVVEQPIWVSGFLPSGVAKVQCGNLAIRFVQDLE